MKYDSTDNKRDEIIRLSQQLIAIPSVAGDTKNNNHVFDLILSYLSGFTHKEFISEGYKSLLFCNTPILPEKFDILFNGHVDVVDGSTPLFKPRIMGDTIVGRGSYDMKAAVAVMLTLFKHHAPCVGKKIGLQIVSDEEIGGFYGTKFQLDQGINAEFVLAGEPTDLKINHCSKGILRLIVELHANSAHSGYPWEGTDLLELFMQKMRAVRNEFPQPTEESWQTTVTNTSLQMQGPSSNSTPHFLKAFFDIRYIDQDEERVLKVVHHHFPQGKIIMHEPIHMCDKKNRFVTQLQQSISTYCPPQFVKKHGSSDVRFYSAKEIPAITFGPVGGGHHSDNEWVSIPSLVNYYNILKDFIYHV